MSHDLKITHLMIALVMVSVSILPLAVLPGEGVDTIEIPNRGLGGYRETLNVSFPKPVFYGDSDPHYNHENLEANTWEDIAIVVLIQDKNKVEKNENQGTQSSTAMCSDIYQAAFIPLDGKTVSTGTQQRILVEDFTATWCTYCTGVIGALDRLDHDETMFPDKFIGVEWHSGGGTYGVSGEEPYNSAVERRDTYEISGGIPRYIIDGMDPWVGGSSSANESSIDTRIRSSISSRSEPASITIDAHAGHTSSEAWVEFTFEVVDEDFINEDVEATIMLLQDAYPRRHGTNPTARLGWIGQDLITQDVMQLEPPGLSFDESTMGSDIGQKGYVEGEFDILWSAYDKEDLEQVEIDLQYRMDRGDWVDLVSGIPNSGSYTWDTMDPRVPDGEDYQLKVIGTDSDGMISELESTLRFEINNPDPPTITSKYPDSEGTVLSGMGEVQWRTWDAEQTAIQLSIDLWISGDGGENYEVLAEDLINDGSYNWDTTEFEDGSSYIVKMRATDSTGLSDETTTPLFEIFNNDPPTVGFTYPAENEVVEGEITITWDSIDEEDDTEEMSYDLYLKYIDDGIWNRLASDQVNTGEFSLDTTDLEFGDGEYQLKIVLEDSHGEYSELAVRSFEIFNPDAPVISNTVAPRSPVSGTVTFSYFLSDPDKGETPLLSPSFYLMKDGQWTLLSEMSANTGSFELDVTDLEDEAYQLKIVVKDPTVQGLESEFIYPGFEVNNPDAPIIEGLSIPTSGENLTGEISLSWSGEDDDGDALRYYLYYSTSLDPSWYPISEAQGIGSSSFVWNISDMDSGEYRIRILAKDGSDARLEAEIVTQSFTIFTPKDVDDTNDDKNGSSKSETTSTGDDNGLLLLLIVVGLALMFILIAFLGVVILMRRRSQPAMTAPPIANPQGALPGNVPQPAPQGLPPNSAQVNAPDRALPPPGQI